MNIKKKKDGNTLTAVISGRIDTSTAPKHPYGCYLGKNRYVDSAQGGR